MGMACDADARGTASTAVIDGAAIAAAPPSEYGGAVKLEKEVAPAMPGMNAEETALILASLSKGKFGPVAFSEGESDGEDDGKHSDMEDISGDEHDDDDIGEDGEHGASGTKVHRVQQINFDGPVGSKLDFMDDAGFSHRFRNESNRVKSLVTKHISIDELRAHFDRPIIDVAKDFGICITLMKKICRRNGIKRWPHRQIRSLSKSIASMEAAMLSAHGGEREKYRDQIMNLKMKRESVIADPNKDNHNNNAMRPKTPTKDGSNSASRALHVSSAPKLSPRTSTPVHLGHGQVLAPVAIKAEAAGSMPTGSSGVMLQPHLNGSSHSSSSSQHSKGGRWTSEEHAAFLEGIRLYGKDWRRVAQVVMTRSAVQTRTHAQKYLLKFAGRFPFDTDGILKERGHHEQDQTMMPDGQDSSGDITMASPGKAEPVYHQTHSMMTPMSQHDATMRDSYETRVQNPSRIEAMAMILNSPSGGSADSNSPSRDQNDRRGVRADALPMYSPMSTSSSLGRALPSLAVPAIKSEQQQESQFGTHASPVSPVEAP
uniref:HTH myb-type domain-containing protein n=1 Tax=Globisporangium ultimum (strain ATCC 200006 / CBS 805.95 / DAOM BR144) TaxID=431595 RepID=K3XA53_GLOUD